tara:strand:+ start:129 stop:506 length:378 start_codon:yes stop_codon:yes gene_type:complete
MKRQNIFESFKNALQGFKTALISDRNLKLHVLFTLIVFSIGLFFKITFEEWCLIVIVIGLVFASELINTAIETLCNTLHPEINPGIKKTKDIAASAVVFSALSALIVGAIIFVPYLKNYFFQITS